MFHKKTNQRVKIKFLVKLKKTDIASWNLLREVYGESGIVTLNSHKMTSADVSGLGRFLMQRFADSDGITFKTMTSSYKNFINKMFLLK